MVSYRICTPQDIPQLRALWKLCFQDSDSFLDFYFSQRFVPAYSVCTVVDDLIVGAIFGLPCHMTLRGVSLASSMSSGFCTHPDHRRKGYFSNLYRLYLKNLRDNGVILAPNTPVLHGSYFPFETRTVSDSRYLKGVTLPTLPHTTQLLDESHLSGLLACYQRNTAHYSAILPRSYADFALRIADCCSDGGLILGILDGDIVTAYGLFFLSKEGLTCVEFIAPDTETAENLVAGLGRQAKGKPMSIKMPPDLTPCVDGLKSSVAPQGVCSLVDTARLLKILGKPMDCTFEITDPVIPENGGIFNFKGEKVDVSPDFTLSVGYFLQAMVGYATFSQLAEQGNCICHSPGYLPLLDQAYPLEICHVPDEY